MTLPNVRGTPRVRRRAAAAAVIVITLFGGLLRLDALAVKYGWLEHPDWAVSFERTLQPLSERLRPAAVPWSRNDKPYVGGDPINYLRFAREMRHFYQAHVREPVFLALTRGMLWLFDGSDIAVSYASAVAGTLAIVGVYLLGAAAWSRSAGLIAASALAIELTAVTWSVDGWRDDTFMLFVALCAWSFVRLLQRPTLGRGVAAGVIAAGACLTRITALSFVLPALLWLAIREWRSRTPASAPGIAAPPFDSKRRELARRAARMPASVAAAAAALLVAPFLVNCWRATGDPFFAINYHTRYYRAAEGLPVDESVSALEYVGQKLSGRPFTTVDTAGVGLLVFPFTNKWTGFAAWWRPLGALLQVFAVAGLIVALWYPEGRLLWIVLVGSLVPYAVTWPVGGGGEWRFTQHAYPIYLVAAASAMVLLGNTVRSALASRPGWRARITSVRRRQAAVSAGALALGWVLYVTLPYLVVREALAAGETVSIAVGDRDLTFFPRSNWSDRVGSGNVHVRVAVADRVSVRLPLPLAVEHVLTLRMDAPQVQDPSYQPRVTVFLDNRTIGHVRFENNPDRVGAYRLAVPAELAGKSFSRLDLVASHTVPAGESGPRFAWLPGETPVAFYLWYVRVEPRLPR